METPEWVKKVAVGDKLVAVEDGISTPIKAGVVYEVRGLAGVQRFWSRCGRYPEDEPAFYIKGIKRELCLDLSEAGICWDTFKPVSKRSTDTGMQTLKGILNNADAPITETA